MPITAEGESKLRITDFSRAAAVSNITDADSIDAGLFDTVYAYHAQNSRGTGGIPQYLQYHSKR